MFPAGLTTIPVRWNSGLNHAGDVLITDVTFVPSQPVVFAPASFMLVDLKWVDTSRGQVNLPAVDQEGFLDLEGNLVTSWFYTAQVTYRQGSTVATVTKIFQPKIGDHLVDLDLVPASNPVDPPTVVVRGVSSVNNLTGDVVLDAALVGAASPSSVSAALTEAKNYTDQALTGLPPAPVTSVNGMTGVVVLAKSHVGLGDVDNTADMTKPVSSPQQLALDLKADLVDGKIPESQLPSYVDDVLEFDSELDFPVVGETGKVYIAKDVNQTFRWTGSAYTRLSEGVALGETSSTAYRGDRGATAYAHTMDMANPHGVTKAQVGLGNVDNTADINKPVSTATQSALDAKLPTSERSVLTVVVSHGVNAFAARPVGYALVIWKGSVDPANKITGDVWVEVP